MGLGAGGAPGSTQDYSPQAPTLFDNVLLIENEKIFITNQVTIVGYRL